MSQTKLNRLLTCSFKRKLTQEEVAGLSPEIRKLLTIKEVEQTSQKDQIISFIEERFSPGAEGDLLLKASQIAIGSNFSPELIGRTLTQLGFPSKIKRLPIKGGYINQPTKVYLCKIKLV